MLRIKTTLIAFFLLNQVWAKTTPDTMAAYPLSLLAAEDSLQYYLDSMRKTRTDARKLMWNNKFKNCLEKTLAINGAFDYPFDSLTTIGKLVSPDKAFRIFNWNLEKKDFTYTYYGFVMVPANKKNKLFELKDMSPTMSDVENQICDNRRWFGCLYYDIFISRSEGKTEYTLLGYDMNDRASKIRLIEGMTISSDKIQFGLPIFTIEHDSEKKKQVRRVVFEYSSEVQMALKYHPKEKRIVFDHLAPNDARAVGIKEYYFPTGLYDALILQENGKWDFAGDVDVRGKKTKIYNDPRKDKQ
jgi:hypothetical protein